MTGPPPTSPLFPSPPLSRSPATVDRDANITLIRGAADNQVQHLVLVSLHDAAAAHLMSLHRMKYRSEEHTSELQSHLNLVCRLLLEKKKTNPTKSTSTTHSY